MTDIDHGHNTANVVNGEVTIVHNRLIASGGLRPLYKGVQPEALESVIARVNDNAVTTRSTYPALGKPGRGEDVVVRPPISRLAYVYYSLKSRGIGTTLKTVLEKRLPGIRP